MSKQPAPYLNPAYPPSPSLASSSYYDTTGRSTYPVFLSLPQTLQLNLTWFSKGIVDAFRWDTVLRTALSDLEIRQHLIKSILLNSVSLISIYTFDFLLHPLVKDQERWFHRNLGWFYKILWLFPVVGVSLYLNGAWCTVVAKRTFLLRYGTRHAMPVATYSGMLTAIATSAYRGVMVFTCIVVSLALGYIPMLGPFLEFIFFCWIDSFYCFEFVWISRNMSLSQRIRHLEERWIYYFGFGLPVTVLCMWGSSLANAALFALVLPSYIIMAMNAHPIPIHPYNPLSSSSAADSTVHYPSPLIPIRMPIFAPIVWLNDQVVGLFSVGGVKNRNNSNATDSGKGRGRGMSESTVVSAEEGVLSDYNLGNNSGRAMETQPPPLAMRDRGSGPSQRNTNVKREDQLPQPVKGTTRVRRQKFD